MRVFHANQNLYRKDSVIMTENIFNKVENCLPDKATADKLLEEGEMNELLEFEPGQADGFEVLLSLDVLLSLS